MEIYSINVSLRENEAWNLEISQKEQLNGTLDENQDLFSGKLEETPFIEHHIDTGDHKPVAVAPYRLSPVRKKKLEKEVESMLQEDIIEESESPWASPVVLVDKNNSEGDARVCGDYRQLNAITKSDKYPPPRIDDLLHDAKGTAYMTTLDLRSSYWQIPVAKADRPKTAFTTHLGLFQYKRMAFGLTNAPATFQRLIDKLKAGLGSVCLFAYLDDLIVCSKSFEEHLQDLKKVFARLRLFKLKMNCDKCHFCCPKVKYLGHILSAEGISPNPEKVESISNWPTPKNIKHLISFLQTCSWYRRFIASFADIAYPLTKLTKKNAKWEWGEEQQTTFSKLKEILASSPVLKQMDENLPFIIKTDASGYAIGAVLVQGEKSDEHPLEYASRLLTQPEKNYSTTEREALAIVWAIKRFRGYIEGSSITVVTDHQPLKWLMSLKSPSGRLARWALTIQAYDVKVEYKPGRTNVVADFLSRPPCDESTTLSCDLCSAVVDVPHKGVEDIRKDQLEDPDLKEIIDCLEDTGQEEKFLRWKAWVSDE